MLAQGIRLMAASKSHLGWNNDHETQHLWIHVDSWQYKVSLSSFKMHYDTFLMAMG